MADRKRVLPATPFTTPMPKVTPPANRSVDEVGSQRLAVVLEDRGVQWPLNGFAPGLYMQTCQHCEKTHMAAKRAMSCLPCALTLAIAEAADHRDRFEEGVAEGRRRATADVVRALGMEVLS